MTTLTGGELFEYLAHLKSEVDKRISSSSEGSLAYLMHTQMGKVIVAEEAFLRYINSNGTQPLLSISPNGLPSVASLRPDLEKMCEVAEDEKSLADVASGFKKGIIGKNKESSNGHRYVPVSKEEWEKEYANRKKEELQAKLGFAISETPDGRFELGFREDLFLKGYDQHSKEFPVLIREGMMRYHVVWNRLIEDCEESFYVPNTALVLSGKLVTPPTRIFDDLEIFYPFKKKDYKSSGERMPWFSYRNWIPKNYAIFLNAGTSARVEITKSILDILGKELGKQVAIKGIRNNDLEAVLAFSSIPFENAPQTTPVEEDLYEVNKDEKPKPTIYRGCKFPTKFELMSSREATNIGTIEYFLPRKIADFCTGRYGHRSRCGYKFDLDWIKLQVFGSAISNESQFGRLRYFLDRVKR